MTGQDGNAWLRTGVPPIRAGLPFAVEDARVRETVARLHKEFFETEESEAALREAKDLSAQISA